ncbi:hypothetical protein HGRIS_010723 [Hohenbuehelia grisea]|uniref:Uncharacterized protein n=1 Tax=Hohenbuehelia grisea TaxID=104357 RepID=A0ABR3IY36_9AGAR
MACGLSGKLETSEMRTRKYQRQLSPSGAQEGEIPWRSGALDAMSQVLRLGRARESHAVLDWSKYRLRLHRPALACSIPMLVVSLDSIRGDNTRPRSCPLDMNQARPHQQLYVALEQR